MILRESMSATGHLITGIREKLSGIALTRDFEVVNPQESVYRKRMIL
jgi:hypothetical protein